MVIIMITRSFLKIFGLDQTQPEAQGVSVQKQQPLLHPKKVPATMACFPPGFLRYVFESPAIERVTCLDKNGEHSHRRALVAQMSCQEGADPDNANATFSMTASLRDLENSGHPQTAEVSQKLCQYYDKNVYGVKKEAENALTAQTKNTIPTKPMTGLAKSNKFVPS